MSKLLLQELQQKFMTVCHRDKRKNDVEDEDDVAVSCNNLF